jgi:hypothetical protein
MRRVSDSQPAGERLDAWAEKANGRVHRTIRAVPAQRLLEEQQRMRPLPARMPDIARRQVIRVPTQPLVRFDRNDYSINPVFVGRRVEVRVSQTEITAVVLDTGELAARHRRVIQSLNGSTIDPVAFRSYFGGTTAANTRQTVLRSNPVPRLISRIDSRSTPCNRLTSAHCSTPTTRASSPARSR